MGDVLSRDMIDRANDLEVEEFEVKEWGGAVCLRVMPNRSRDLWERAREEWGADRKLGGVEGMCLVAVLGMCDPAGEAMYPHENLDELREGIDALMHKNPDVILAISDKVLDKAGLGEDDDADPVDSAEEN